MLGSFLQDMSRESLRASAARRQSFDQRYGAFQAETAVRSAFEAYRRDRFRRLLLARSEFETELRQLRSTQQLTPDTAAQRLRKYLCWQGDERITVSLDYLPAVAISLK